MKEKIKIMMIVIFSIFLLYIAYGEILTYRYNYVCSIPQKMEYITNHINNGFPNSNKQILQNNNIIVKYGDGFDSPNIQYIEYDTNM